MNHFLQKRRCKSFRRKTAVLCVFAGLLALCCGCGRTGTSRIQKMDTAMGTVVRQDLYVTKENSAATDEIMACIRALEEETLSRRLATAEVYRINEAAGTKIAGKEAMIPVSEKLTGILKECLEVSEKSGGAFDITLGSVVKLWNIDEWAAGNSEKDIVLPTEEELKEALAFCGYERFTVKDTPSGYEAALPEGMQLDLGAVGKGIALTEIAALLKEQDEVSGAVISVGGSILTYGSKPNNESFKVAIINPLDETKGIGYLELQGEWCVSTSGDYERYVEVDGVRYHHILHPKTGRPAHSGLRSVTILTKNGLLSDALSTACFVLGEERGLALAEAYGVQALFVNSRGEVLMTDGMGQYFRAY